MIDRYGWALSVYLGPMISLSNKSVVYLNYGNSTLASYCSIFTFS